MKVTFKANFKTVQTVEAVERAAEAGLDAVADMALRDSNEKAPKLSGAMRATGKKRNDGIGKRTLVWSGLPYILYQWFGVRADGTHRVRHYTTPGTGTQWAERAAEEHKADWLKAGQAAFRKGMR